MSDDRALEADRGIEKPAGAVEFQRSLLALRRHPAEQEVLSADDVQWTSAIGVGAIGLVLTALVAKDVVTFDAALGFLLGWFACFVALFTRAFVRQWRRLRPWPQAPEAEAKPEPVTQKESVGGGDKGTV